ncbi:MAG TPA: C1 family peptidase [Xanthobacteraceae bacterium]
MKRALIVASVLLLSVGALSASARAQGAIIETLDDLKNVPEAPGFRGGLPASIDLSSTLPPPADQGSSGSCTSWAITYAAASQALRRAGIGPSLRLSPSFTYNKLARDSMCRFGTATSETLDMLRDVGALPFEKFVYDAGWCGRLATDAELQEAAKYRIKSWSKLDARKIEDVKAQLARGVPVVFDMRTNEQFHDLKGSGVFDFPGVMSGGGHSMIAIGYDDARKAFRIQNSWGRKFGEGGYAWLGYDFWTRNVGVGYVID